MLLQSKLLLITVALLLTLNNRNASTNPCNREQANESFLEVMSFGKCLKMLLSSLSMDWTADQSLSDLTSDVCIYCSTNWKYVGIMVILSLIVTALGFFVTAAFIFYFFICPLCQNCMCCDCCEENLNIYG